MDVALLENGLYDIHKALEQMKVNYNIGGAEKIEEASKNNPFFTGNMLCRRRESPTLGCSLLISSHLISSLQSIVQDMTFEVSANSIRNYAVLRGY